MPNQDLTSQLEALGFEVFPTGGGCEALVRQQRNADGELISEVVTSIDGGSLPEADDWLFCSYNGDWKSDADCPMKDNGDSECSPVSLVELVSL
jgi:hypothetical protein